MMCDISNESPRRRFQLRMIRQDITYSPFLFLFFSPFDSSSSLALLLLCLYSTPISPQTSRELTRLESTSRSPIYALFGETLDGLSTIRAYKSEKRFRARNDLHLDNNQKAFFLNFSANCWLAVRLEFAGTLIATFAALFAVLGRDTKKYGPLDTTAVENREAFARLAGLSISFALSVSQSLNWSVRMASDLESQMVSVERVKAFSK